MSEDNISKVVDPSVKPEIIETTEALWDLTKAVIAASKASRDFELKITPDKNLSELVKSINLAVDANGQLIKSAQGYTKAAEAQTQAEKNLAEARLANAQAQKIENQIQKESIALSEKAEKQAKASKGAYADLNKEYREAAKLAKDLASQHGVESAAAKEAAARALELGNRLKEIDVSVGQNQRNVGNYKSHWDGMRNAMQQVGRELPNFTQSMEIGFRSITNNIGAVQDAITATREKNKALRAEGKETTSVFSQMVGGLVNWQTAILVGVGLIATYWKDIKRFLADIFSATTSLDRITRDFEASQKKSAEATAKEVAELNILVGTLQSTTATREEVIEAIEKAKANYPEYLGFITEENRMTSEVNASLEQQLDLIRKKSVMASFQDAYTKATERAQTAEQEYTTLLQQKDARLSDIKAKQDVLNKALAEAEQAYTALQNPMQTITNNLREQVAADEDLVKAAQKELTALELQGKASGEYAKKLTVLVAGRKELIDVNNQYIETMERIFKMESPGKKQFSFSPEVLDQKDIEARLKLAKNGSKQERELAVQNEQAKNRVAISELKKRYTEEHKLRVEDLAGNASYQAELKLLNADTQNSIEQIKERYAKKHTPKTPKAANMTNEILDFEEKLNDSIAAGAKQQMSIEAEKSERIFNDEKQTLEARLAEYERFNDLKLSMLDADRDAETKNIIAHLDKIAELEGKQAKGGKLVKEELDQLNGKAFYLQELANINNKYRAEEEKLETDSLAKIRQITEHAYDEQVQLAINKVNDIAAATYQQYEVEDAILVEKLGKRRLTEKQFEAERKALKRKYDQEITTQTIAFLNEQIELLKTLGADTTKLEEYITDLKKKESGKRIEIAENEVKDKLRLLKEEQDQAAKVSMAMLDAGQSLAAAVENIYSAQAEKHQTRLDEITAERDAEIEAIQKVGLSDEEVAKRTAMIKGKYYQQEIEQNRNMARIKRRAAVAEKVAGLLSIAANTATGMMKAFADLPLIAAIAAAAAIGIAGTAQTYIVASKPLPEYRYGTPAGGHPADGPAVVGDGGETERLTLPDGTERWTPSVPTAMWLPKGTEVTPLSKIVEGQSGTMAPYVEAISGGMGSTVHLEHVMKEGFESVNRTISAKPETSFVMKNGEWRKTVTVANFKTEYLNNYGID